MIQVNLDRPNFTLNPTNCAPFNVDATLTGEQGTAASIQAPFQVANCRDLDYAPKLSLSLKGGLNRLGHPAIKAVLKTKPGESNSRRVSVTLPDGQLLDNAHIGTVCTRVQFAAGSCPEQSRLGTATAWSPLLDAPVQGAVYLRSSSNRLPDLVADLKGQVDVELSARIDAASGGRLRANFSSIPDVPVEKFVMNLQGGKKGLLQNSRPLCGKQKKANVDMTGQNGLVTHTKVPLRYSCGSKTKHKEPGRRGGCGKRWEPRGESQR